MTPESSPATAADVETPEDRRPKCDGRSPRKRDSETADVQVRAAGQNETGSSEESFERRFEALLMDLCVTFANLPVEEVDEQIEHALHRLGRLLDIDRSSFAEFSEDRPDMVVTHCYVAPGITPFPRLLVDRQLPWYAEQIRRGEVLRFARLPDDAPPEAVAEREYCRREGLKSNLAIPLKVGGSLRCVITFATFREYREWPDELVRRLWLVGEIFAGSLARKRSDVRMHQLQDQLMRMRRVALVGEVAAAIAHEIKQPLCAIVSNAQAGERLLSGDSADLNEVREVLQDIASDSRRANEILARVRDELQRREPAGAPLQLNDAIREVVILTRGQLMQSGVALSLDLLTDLPRVTGDRIQLQQVFFNLVQNAIDAMSDGRTETRELTIQTERTATEEVMVTVRDSGPGIAPEHLERVFESFFTTKPNGVGIGLAISQSIVESHGGRIRVSSEPGRGASFHLILPVLQEWRPQDGDTRVGVHR